jgi:lipopolysaccharide export system permease protein
MRLLDAYILRYFLLAYGVCFASLLSLYIVIDLFAKMDEFAVNADSWGALLSNISTYYLFRLPWFFHRLSGIFCLLSAIFALAWMEHQNELVPCLAAGIPGRRLIYPVLAATLIVTGLGVINREWLIPMCSTHLQRSADDPHGAKQVMVQGGYDSNLVHFEGLAADIEQQVIRGGRLTFPSHLAGRLIHLYCAEMRYCPEANGWRLHGTVPEIIDCPQAALRSLTPGVYFLQSSMTFDRLTRSGGWFQYESTPELLRMLHQDGTHQRRIEVIALLHRRLTGPLLDVLLVLLGLGIVQAGQAGRNIFIKFGLCFITYGVFMGLQFLCSGMAGSGFLDPLLAAWVPVFIFGSAVFATLDHLRG